MLRVVCLPGCKPPHDPLGDVQWVASSDRLDCTAADVALGIPGQAAQDFLTNRTCRAARLPLVLLDEAADDDVVADWMSRGAADVLTSTDPRLLLHVLQREAERYAGWRDLDELLNHSAAFVIALNLDLKITWINRIRDELGDMDPIGMDALTFIAEENQDRVMAAYQRVLETGVAETYETGGTSAGGTPAWYRTLVGPIHRAGRIVGLCLIAQDITEERETQLGLRESEARLTSLFETTPDAILTITADGLIESVNSSAERLFGYPREELLGRDAGGLLQSGSSGRFATLVGRLGGRLTGRVFEYVARRRDGHAFPVSLSVGSWKHDGQMRYSAIVRDLTEQKRADEELARANARLVAAARRAGMADVARGALHNIGNAMTSVAIGATVLARRLDPDRSAALLQIAQHLEKQENNGPTVEALRRLACLMSSERQEKQKLVHTMNRRLSDITEILHAQQQYARAGGVSQVTRLPDLIDDALAQQQHRVRAMGLRIARHFEPLPEVEIDRIRLLQVVSNLVKNAMESLEQARPANPSLEISVSARDNNLRIAITDNGQGFDEAMRSQLFRSGFTTKDAGQGLGLHFCYNTMREMGGSIGAESPGVGRGATFVLEVPCVSAAVGPEPSLTTAA